MVSVLTLDSAGGQSARELMPFALFAPPAVALLAHLGGARSLYRPEIELAVGSAVSAASLSALVWATATRLHGSERMRRRAETESLTDPLTGLANRRSLDTAFAEQRRVIGRDHPYSVVVADLDDLKRVNDERGHAAGDEALRRVASVLRDVTRPTDVTARVGGDEFVVLLRAADAADARRIVARITRLRKRWGLASRTARRLRSPTSLRSTPIWSVRPGRAGAPAPSPCECLNDEDPPMTGPS